MSETVLDINKRLNDIIFKYGLDSDYPNYRKGMMAENYIRNLMLEFKKENKKVLCLAVAKRDIMYFSFLSKHVGGDIDFKLFDRKAFNQINLAEYDEVYAISLQYAYIVHRCQGKGVKCRSIYLEMKRQGLVFERECYRICNPYCEDFIGKFNDDWYIEGLQIEHFLLKQYLDFDCSDEERFFYLRNIYFLSLRMKDFLNASKYIAQIMELDIAGEIKAEYEESWEEIQDLLNQVKEVLKRRKQKDIIMNWMDAVAYDECSNMTFINDCRQRGINFTNAFTVMSYTHETCKTIFRGTLPLSDYFDTEKISDSKLMKYIEQYGYRFKILSGCSLDSYFNAAYGSEIWSNRGTSCSEILWDMLSCLMSMKEPAFILGHLLLEGHGPNLYSVYSDMTANDFVDSKSRVSNARLQLDKQLEYYAGFFPDESIMIYMSDHGKDFNSFFDRSHINLIITGENIEHKDIEGLFSYVRFPDMILQLLQDGRINEDELTGEYVRLEYMDWYNGKAIYNWIKKKKKLRIFPQFGYQGVVTKEYIYAKYSIGKEVLFRRDNTVMLEAGYFTVEDEINVTNAEELLPYFRSMNIDTDKIYEQERFKYSRYLRKIYENYKKYSTKKYDLLNELFSTFEDQSVALRMGGQHTIGIWRMLSEDNRKKINCIIDRNRDCAAGVLGYPVVMSIDDVDFDDVKVCIPSSYAFKKRLSMEMKDYPVDVINLYDYMREHGLEFEREIYRCEELPDWVYDVGFPFEDFE